MRTSYVKNGLAVGVILLFVGVAVIPAIGLSNNDDTTPPVTTHTLEPPEPNGDNGWYVSDVNITLNATDDMSGVKEIRYTINGGWEQYIWGSSGTFVLSWDGNDFCIEYWAIDNAGNVEPKNTIMPLIDTDQTPPDIELMYEFEVDPLLGLIYIFTANATDWMSGMDRVEFYMGDELVETVYGTGPLYEWIWDLSETIYVRGLILNPEITEEYVRFFAILVRISESYNYSYVGNITSACAYDNAGNWEVDRIESVPCSPVNMAPGVYIFWNLKLPNKYTGYIGRFLIYATFDTS